MAKGNRKKWSIYFSRKNSLSFAYKKKKRIYSLVNLMQQSKCQSTALKILFISNISLNLKILLISNISPNLKLAKKRIIERRVDAQTAIHSWYTRRYEANNRNSVADMNTFQRLVNSSSFHFRTEKGGGKAELHLRVVTESRDYPRRLLDRASSATYASNTFQGRPSKYQPFN